MEAPDKIYLHPDIGNRNFIRPWLIRPANDESVEYIRKDAIRNFIFKMIDALNDRHLLDAAIHCALNGIIEELDSL